MSFWLDLWSAGFGILNFIPQFPFKFGFTDKPSTFDPTTTNKSAHGTRMAIAAAAIIAATSAPTIYAYMLTRKKKKGKLTEKEEIYGRTLENRAAMIHNTTLAALSSPAIAVPLAYIAVQALEDFPPEREYKKEDGTVVKVPGGVISKGLGNDIQTALAVYAAGGVVQGIGNIASAFVRR